MIRRIVLLVAGITGLLVATGTAAYAYIPIKILEPLVTS